MPAFHSLPRPVLRAFTGVAKLAAAAPPLRPPTRDGFTLDAEIALGLRLHAASNPPPLHTLSPQQARAEHLAQAGPFQPQARRKAPTIDIVLEADGLAVPARVYRGGEAALFWIHGGGWVIGSVETDDALCHWIVEQTGLSVVSIDYRLAPEHPFPAGHDDALAAWKAFTRRAPDLGIDLARTAIGGASAGGNLAAATCLDARDAGIPLPAYQLLIYPATEMTASFPSIETMGEGFVLDRPLIDWFKQQFIPREEWDNPRVSVLFRDDLSGVPPAHVLTAGFDPLRDEGRAFACRLREAGVPVWDECAPGLVHSFVELAGLSRTSREYLLRAVTAMSDALEGGADALHPGFHRPRVAIVGAGSSGLAAAKALGDAGVPYTCFEAGPVVGGNWVFKNPNGVSSAYRSLHINTSRRAMEYRDFSMPETFPDYPHHSLMREYFEDYADHFGLRTHIAFETRVEKVEPLPHGDELPGSAGWSVTTRGPDGVRTETFDAVLVGNGHHWDPQWPEPVPPGDFDGVQLHAHDYIDPDEPHALRGKRVVVVGFGNSAMDIACELSQRGVAERVFLAVRRGGYVLPHYFFGVPSDQFAQDSPGFLPGSVSRRAFGWLHRATVGRMESYGLPKPDHAILAAHPTISSELLPRIGRGDIVVKPNIAELHGDRVRFEDGSEEAIDAIVWCTGYKVTFPFFDRTVIDAPDNDLPLFKRVVSPDHAGLFFLGLIQPLGAVMPLVEAQSQWIAELLTGVAKLPKAAAMRADMHKERAKMFARYVKSKRHTMQVDFQAYLDAIAEERAAGRTRR